MLQHLKVVNDIAERGLATATNFNGQLTADDEKWQNMIRGVEHHRKLYPGANKKTTLKCLFK